MAKRIHEDTALLVAPAPVSAVRIRRKSATFAPTLENLERLKTYPANWNGGGEAPPNPLAIERAKAWISEAFSISPEAPLQPDSVVANEDGDAVIEWHRGAKRLAITFSTTEIWYLKAWGADMATEMEDNDIQSPADFLPLHQWLCA